MSDHRGDTDKERQTSSESPLSIVTLDSHKAPVWTHFRFHKDASSWNSAIGSKAVCKLCQKEVARSGGTTNLINHLPFHHCAEFELLTDGDKAGGSGHQKIVEFLYISHLVQSEQKI